MPQMSTLKNFTKKYKFKHSKSGKTWCPYMAMCYLRKQSRDDHSAYNSKSCANGAMGKLAIRAENAGRAENAENTGIAEIAENTNNDKSIKSLVYLLLLVITTGTQENTAITYCCVSSPCPFSSVFKCCVGTEDKEIIHYRPAKWPKNVKVCSSCTCFSQETTKNVMYLLFAYPECAYWGYWVQRSACPVALKDVWMHAMKVICKIRYRICN